jgi:DNA-binding NarL/FixJ family response regulator
MIKVAIADDHAVVRRGLEELLRLEADIEVVGTAADGREACELAERTTPDVILMDLSMPLMDGIEATRSIVASTPAVHVIVLTSFADRSRILAALDAGATGYLLKDADPAEVAAAIRAAVAGGVPLDPRAARVMLDAQRTVQREVKLSARESEVLQLVVAGLANKSIARRLGITERTVKAHLTSIFQQLQVGDRTQAALWAQEHLTNDKPG